MRRIISVFFILFSILSFSQTKFGIAAGINNSFLTEGVAQGFYIEPSIGVQFGVFCEVDITKSVHFRPKLMYSEQGDRYKTNNFGTSSQELSTIDYKLNYLNIPLDFKFGNKIYAVAGPQIGVLVGKKIEGSYFGTVQSELDFGINIGGGVQFNNLFVEVGAYQGLTTVFQYYYGSTGNLVKANNGCLKLALGYYFL